jgi:hypothetical protein
MSLGDFKFIYCGMGTPIFSRLLVSPLPSSGLFHATRKIELRLWPSLRFGGAQEFGLVHGSSGLIDRVDVSQYRLAAHLTLAALIFSHPLRLTAGARRQHHLRMTGSQFFLRPHPANCRWWIVPADAGQGYATGLRWSMDALGSFGNGAELEKSFRERDNRAI